MAFTENNDTETLPVLGGTFDALGGDDRISYTGGVVTIDGGDGSDTVDFLKFDSAMWASLSYDGDELWTRDRPDLASGTWRSLGNLRNVENLVGTRHSDYLQGNNDANALFYTGGYDTLDGAGGMDTVNFSQFNSALWIDLAYAGSEAWTTDRSDLASGTWRAIADIANVENVVGTDHNDVILGDANPNALIGGTGNDTLTGRGGNDRLDGGAGIDTAVFSNAATSYNFQFSGSDILVTGASEGTDTVSNTVETFQFAGQTVTREQLLAEVTPPTFTENADTVALPFLGGTFAALGGDDNLSYRGGSVTVDGGTGVDAVNFSQFGSAVWVDLAYAGSEAWTMDRPDLTSGTWRALGDLTNVENLVGTGYSDFLQGNNAANTLFYTGGYDTLNGQAGTDTVDFSAYGSAVWVDLAYAGSEAWTTDRPDLASGTWRAISDLASLENVVGTAQADVIMGDDNANVLIGGAGNDTLSGRGGVDTVSYANTTSSVTANLTTGVATGDGTDTLASIENLTGGSGNDTLTGNSSANVLDGGVGDDVLNGNEGNDTLLGRTGNDALNGGDGVDTASYADATGAITANLTTGQATGAGTDTLTSIENLIGGAFNDTLTGSSAANVLDGGTGDDILNGGAGDDVLIGGAGTDTVSFDNASGPVSVNLTIATSQTTGDGNDILTSIENVTGGSGHDTLRGNAANNVLSGELGDDVLIGDAGDDVLNGAAGNDLLIGDLGNDALNGGDGVDTASYADSAVGVTVSLAVTTSQNTVGAGSDTLTAIENLIGSSFNDTLVGNDANNLLNGGLGNDMLVGDLGDDTLLGGDGIDTVSYAGTTAVNVDLLSGTATGIGNDTILLVEHVIGSSANDTLIGDAASNTLDGGDGNDVITGGAGNDMLIGGLGNDTFVYANFLDVFAGGADTVVGAALGDTINFSTDLESVFKIGNTTLTALTATKAVGKAISASDSVSFDNGHLQFDVNGNGVFNVAEDFDISLSGVTSVSYDATVDAFLLGVLTPTMKIALTFDDGPWTTHTQQVLDVLNLYNVDATFFVIGQQITGNEALVESMIQQGHLVENHSWDHVDLTLSTTDELNSLTLTSNAIFGAAGQLPEYYRPPYGVHNAETDAAAATLDMQPVTWTVDTNDWNTLAEGGTLPLATEQSIIDAVLTGATDNGVILMHDGGGDRSLTAAALDNIITGLQSAGYELVTLDEIPSLPIDFLGGTTPNQHLSDLVPMA